MVDDCAAFGRYVGDVMDEAARAAEARGAVLQRRLGEDGALSLMSLYRDGVGLDLTLMRRDLSEGVWWSERARLLVLTDGRVIALGTPFSPFIQLTIRGACSRLTGALEQDLKLFWEGSDPVFAAWLERFWVAPVA